MILKKLVLFSLILILSMYYIIGCSVGENDDYSINVETKETEEEELRKKLIHMDLEQIQEGQLIKYEEVIVLHLARPLQNYIIFSLREETLYERTSDILISFGDEFENLPHKVGITAGNDLIIVGYETENGEKRQIDKFLFRDKHANVIYEKNL